MRPTELKNVSAGVASNNIDNNLSNSIYSVTNRHTHRS